MTAEKSRLEKWKSRNPLFKYFLWRKKFFKYFISGKWLRFCVTWLRLLRLDRPPGWRPRLPLSGLTTQCSDLSQPLGGGNGSEKRTEAACSKFTVGCFTLQPPITSRTQSLCHFRLHCQDLNAAVWDLKNKIKCSYSIWGGMILV